MTPTNNYGCVSYPTAKALMLAGLEFETNICYNEEGGIFEAKGSGEILYLKTGKFSHIGTVDFVASPTFEDIWNELPETIRAEDEGLFCLRKDKIGFEKVITMSNDWNPFWITESQLIAILAAFSSGNLIDCWKDEAKMRIEVIIVIILNLLNN